MGTLKPRCLGFLLTAVLVLSVAAAALADNVHFVSGPTFTDNGLTLSAAGTLAGLGNTNIDVVLSATANPTAICSNHGKHQPPGQNPASVTVTGGQSIPAHSIKNGSVGISVTTNPPTSPIPGAPGCPNSGWTETITDMVWTSATITVNGTQVFTCALSDVGTSVTCL